MVLDRTTPSHPTAVQPHSLLTYFFTTKALAGGQWKVMVQGVQGVPLPFPVFVPLLDENLGCVWDVVLVSRYCLFALGMCKHVEKRLDGSLQ